MFKFCTEVFPIILNVHPESRREKFHNFATFFTLTFIFLVCSLCIGTGCMYIFFCFIGLFDWSSLELSRADKESVCEAIQLQVSKKDWPKKEEIVWPRLLSHPDEFSPECNVLDAELFMFQHAQPNTAQQSIGRCRDALPPPPAGGFPPQTMAFTLALDLDWQQLQPHLAEANEAGLIDYEAFLNRFRVEPGPMCAPSPLWATAAEVNRSLIPAG